MDGIPRQAGEGRQGLRIDSLSGPISVTFSLAHHLRNQGVVRVDFHPANSAGHQHYRL